MGGVGSLRPGRSPPPGAGSRCPAVPTAPAAKLLTAAAEEEEEEVSPPASSLPTSLLPSLPPAPAACRQPGASPRPLAARSSAAAGRDDPRGAHRRGRPALRRCPIGTAAAESVPGPPAGRSRPRAAPPRRARAEPSSPCPAFRIRGRGRCCGPVALAVRLRAPRVGTALRGRGRRPGGRGQRSRSTGEPAPTGTCRERGPPHPGVSGGRGVPLPHRDTPRLPVCAEKSRVSVKGEVKDGDADTLSR